MYSNIKMGLKVSREFIRICASTKTGVRLCDGLVPSGRQAMTRTKLVVREGSSVLVWPPPRGYIGCMLFNLVTKATSHVYWKIQFLQLPPSMMILLTDASVWQRRASTKWVDVSKNSDEPKRNKISTTVVSFDFTMLENILRLIWI